MISVRAAYKFQYFNTDDRQIEDGLSLYVNKKDLDGYTHRLQLTKNNVDVWLVSWADDMDNLFFVADSATPGSCGLANREKFFDFVSENTPEMFEWCLFHLFCDKIEVEVEDDTSD